MDVAYRRYLAAMAGAITRFRQKYPVFPILVAMEQLDQGACRQLKELLGGAPVFTSDQYDMYQLVSILRASHLMVSSRYHAIVTSMPALIPSAGITMDERIRNLMRERGHEHLLLDVDDAELETKLFDVMVTLCNEADKIREDIGGTVVKNLQLMARMGMYLQEHVARRYPEFPVRAGILSWEDYLPPLSPTLFRLLEHYGSQTEAVEARSA